MMDLLATLLGILYRTIHRMEVNHYGTGRDRQR
jgi:hypothetical protein